MFQPSGVICTETGIAFEIDSWENGCAAHLFEEFGEAQGGGIELLAG